MSLLTPSLNCTSGCLPKLLYSVGLLQELVYSSQTRNFCGAERSTVSEAAAHF